MFEQVYHSPVGRVGRARTTLPVCRIRHERKSKQMNMRSNYMYIGKYRKPPPKETRGSQLSQFSFNSSTSLSLFQVTVQMHNVAIAVCEREEPVICTAREVGIFEVQVYAHI